MSNLATLPAERSRRMIRLSERPVSVTMTGAEWAAMLSKLIERRLSPDGYKVYRHARMKLASALEEECNQS